MEKEERYFLIVLSMSNPTIDMDVTEKNGRKEVVR